MTEHPRYLSTYREVEMDRICLAAKQGESMCFVGVAGTGKSNLNKVLREEVAIKHRYLGDDVDNVHFAIMDATAWNGTPQHLWEMMLSALERATAHLASALPVAKVIQLSSDGPALSRLQGRLAQICQSLGQQVMFVLDDFDDVLRRGPLPTLEQLSALRNDGNRQRLSYLVFTKRLPHVLGRSHNLAQQSKFYDLFRHNIFALPLHNDRDAYQMLLNINSRVGKPLRGKELAQILSLAGGHARLLRVVFDVWLSNPPRGDLVEQFANAHDVDQEIARLLNGLHRNEREAAIRLAHGASLDQDDVLLAHLVKRGLLRQGDALHWFSPLIAPYLRRQKLPPAES